MQNSFARITTGLNVGDLLGAIDKHPELWGEITARQTTPGSAHADTESIFLRWAKTQTVDAVFTEIPAIDYPATEKLPAAKQLIDHVMEIVGASKLGRAMLTSLNPGGLIKPHVDEGEYADHYERFHVVIKSEDGNKFFARDNNQTEVASMQTGELWWFNHKAEHWVINYSRFPRIHLIIDAVAPLYRRERHAV